MLVLPSASWAPMLPWMQSGALGVAGLVLVACAPAPRAETPTPDRAPTPAPEEAAAPSSERVPEGTATPSPSAPSAVTLDHPGCFLLLDLQGDGTPKRGGAQPCDERTIPASTFKVPHALVALETGVVTDPDTKEKWDGTRYPHMKAWERDHDLRSAIYESVVWFFQGTARAIGRERMREHLESLRFGNAAVEGPIDRFWLGGGSLEISPDEWLRVLADLYRGDVPWGQAHLPVLREMLVRPPSSFAGRMPEGSEVPPMRADAIFSAKTGTGSHDGGSVTWMVGHVACPEHEHVFVSRVISDEPPGRVSPAVAHGLAALDARGVLSCTPH